VNERILKIKYFDETWIIWFLIILPRYYKNIWKYYWVWSYVLYFCQLL